MSEQLQSLPLSICPVISYPQEAQSGKTYLLEIDLEATGSIDEWEWKYEEEEYPIFCEVETVGDDSVSSLFQVRSKGTPEVVLHRFGGTYGAAKFYLTAVDKDIEGEIRITLSSAWGAPLKMICLEQIRVSRKRLDVEPPIVDEISIDKPAEVGSTRGFQIGNQKVVLETKEITIAEFEEQEISTDDEGVFEGFPPLEEFSFEVPTIVFDAEETKPSLPPIEMQSVEVATVVIEKEEPQNELKDYSISLTRSTDFLRLAGRKEVHLEMVAIHGGTFMMGSPESDSGAFDREKPQHEVIVPDFYMGRYPVTQLQWKALMDDNPSTFKDDRHPVEQVSWNDAVKFCGRLTEKTGKQYRLPTEAEWEYACRADSTTKYYFGDDRGQRRKYFWYSGNSQNKTHPVGEKEPNRFGLYDMHGNVWEWCLDHWHGNYEDAPTDGSAWLNENREGYRVRRGGSWGNLPRYCRSAARNSSDPDDRGNIIGFRVVCVP